MIKRRDMSGVHCLNPRCYGYYTNIDEKTSGPREKVKCIKCKEKILRYLQYETEE